MSLDNQRLLEMAAKAAGLRIDKSPFNGGGRGNTGFDMDGNAMLDWHNGIQWNPLKNDGDALRLAVKLEMKVEIENHTARAVTMHGDHEAFQTLSNPLAATRRAIVRAASALGEAMP